MPWPDSPNLLVTLREKKGLSVAVPGVLGRHVPFSPCDCSTSFMVGAPSHRLSGSRAMGSRCPETGGCRLQ